MKALLIFMLLLSGGATTSDAAETTLTASNQQKVRPKIIVTARRSLPSGLEEVSLSLEGDTATYVLNSNFLAEPQNQVRLGFFNAPMNEGLKAEYDDLIALSQSAKASIAKAPAKGIHRQNSPHSIQVSLNDQSMPSSSPAFEEIVDLFGRIGEMANWKARDGVELTRDRESNVTGRKISESLKRPAPLPKDDLSCRPLAEGTYCLVKGYGHAYF